MNHNTNCPIIDACIWMYQTNMWKYISRICCYRFALIMVQVSSVFFFFTVFSVHLFIRMYDILLKMECWIESLFCAIDPRVHPLSASFLYFFYRFHSHCECVFDYNNTNTDDGMISPFVLRLFLKCQNDRNIEYFICVFSFVCLFVCRFMQTHAISFV